jgi:hypothetical protein
MQSGTARSQPGDAQPSMSYFEWRPAGNAVTIRLSLAVIERLEAAIMDGFRSLPRRGAEVGGVLFGQAAMSDLATTVTIDDFEPVECEHRRGPSYVLSDADKRRLERTLRKGRPDRQVVGFYRSHTRLGLYLDQDDDSLAHNYFPGSSQVFLLVRPHATKSGVAGFFFWEEGTIHRQSTYLQFPFRRSELQAAAPASAPPASAPAPVPAAARRPALVWKRAIEAADALLARARRLRNVRWERLLAGLGVLLCLGAVEYLVLRAQFRSTASTPALRVERRGGYLDVRWNRDAPDSVRAERGLLEITDGSARQQLRLDAGQLRTGSVAYSPRTNDVSIRLELFGAAGTRSESLRVVDNTHRATPCPVVEQAQPPPPAQPRSSPPQRANRRAWQDDGL